MKSDRSTPTRARTGRRRGGHVIVVLTLVVAVAAYSASTPPAAVKSESALAVIDRSRPAPPPVSTVTSVAPDVTTTSSAAPPSVSPTRWPTGAVLPATVLRPQPRGRLVVTGVGDTNLDPRYIPALRRHGYEHAFSGLQDVFLDDDLTIINFECAASTTGRRQAKLFTFNCDVGALPIMQAAGVEVANLGNNHSRDWGEAALLDTIENVEAAGVAAVGVGATTTEAHQAAYLDINGWRVAVLGFGGVIPSRAWIATDEHPGMADGDDIETMVAAVEAASAQADLVFVSIHWGKEGDTRPRSDDVARAHAMIDAGADVIFGHHSHRLQPLEFYKGKPIAWGLGNFVWPRLSLAGARTAVAQVVVEPDGAIAACLIPTEIESSGHPVIQVDYEGLCVWEGHQPAVYRGSPVELTPH